MSHHVNGSTAGEIAATLARAGDTRCFTVGHVVRVGESRMIVTRVAHDIGVAYMRPETWWEAALWYALTPLRWARKLSRLAWRLTST